MNLPKVLDIILPTKMQSKGTAHTGTFNPSSSAELLTFPTYQEHLVDLYNLRQSSNSQEIIEELFSQDADLANTVWSFLTVADVTPLLLAYDQNEQIDREALKTLNLLLNNMSQRNDYTLGYQNKKTLNKIAEEIRHMLLLRGAAGVEAVYNELYVLNEIRHIDMYNVRYYETEAGAYKPEQQTSDGETISLDIPTFFTCDLYKLPNKAYGTSPFTTAINAIAATQQVINDLYRIMSVTGYPRLDVKVLEDVLLRSAPKDVVADESKRVSYLNAVLSQLTGQFYDLRPDLPAVHTDAVELSIVNEKAPGIGIDISNVIKVLDAQKQSGLHTLSTILGRGESGVNTATVESRLFTMSADALNKPVGDVLSDVLTQALRITGSLSRVVVQFPEPELRSETELEAQLQLRQTRLRYDLSLGLITDEEYHLKVYGRLAPESVPQLSGTLFEHNSGIEVDAEKVSPNSDPLGRSVSNASDKAAKSNEQPKTKK